MLNKKIYSEKISETVEKELRFTQGYSYTSIIIKYKRFSYLRTNFSFSTPRYVSQKFETSSFWQTFVYIPCISNNDWDMLAVPVFVCWDLTLV